MRQMPEDNWKIAGIFPAAGSRAEEKKSGQKKPAHSGTGSVTLAVNYMATGALIAGCGS